MPVMKDGRVKLNFFISEELYNFILTESKEKGTTLTAELINAIVHYRDYKDGLKAMRNTSQMGEMLERLKTLVDDKRMKLIVEEKNEG
jgi:hypothetical protein